MNARTRLLKCLSGEKVDRVPFVCPGGMINMVVEEVWQSSGIEWEEGHRSPQAMASLAILAGQMTGIENLGVPFCMTAEAEDMGASVDAATPGVEPRVTGYAMENPMGWKELRDIRPGVGRTGVVADAVRLLSSTRGELPVIACLTGPFSLATSLVEPMIFYRSLGREPVAACALLDKVTESLVVYARELLAAGIDVLVIADPGASGEIVGPRHFARYALPYLNRILDNLPSGTPTMVHICGRLKSVAHLLGELRSPAVSIDSATSVGQILSACPEKLVAGNVSTHLLLTGTPEEVARASARCIDNGVHILTPACGVSPQTPTANLRAMARAVESCTD